MTFDRAGHLLDFVFGVVVLAILASYVRRNLPSRIPMTPLSEGRYDEALRRRRLRLAGLLCLPDDTLAASGSSLLAGPTRPRKPGVLGSATPRADGKDEGERQVSPVAGEPW